MTGTNPIYYSHFDDIFLSHQDRHAYSGWVAPGKGGGENCLYCGGACGNQKAAFGRAKPFLRSEQSVRRDHQETARSYLRQDGMWLVRFGEAARAATRSCSAEWH